jgi:hypothetical protein
MAASALGAQKAQSTAAIRPSGAAPMSGAAAFETDMVSIPLERRPAMARAGSLARRGCSNRA